MAKRTVFTINQGEVETDAPPKEPVVTRRTSFSEALPRVDPDAPSRIGSFARGAMKRLGTYADTAMDMRQNLTPSMETIKRGATIDYGPRIDQGVRATADDLGALKATDQLGVSLERAGEYTVDAAAMLPFAVASAPALGVSPVALGAAELGMSGLGGFASGELEQAGHPMLGTAAALGLGFATRGPAGAMTLTGSRMNDAYRHIRQMTGPVSRYMQRVGMQGQVSRRALVGGAEELLRRVPDRRVFQNAMRRGVKINERLRSVDPDAGVRTRQLADDIEFDLGGPWFAHMDENLSKTNIEYGTATARRRGLSLRTLAQEWDDLGGDEAADFVMFLDDYDEGQRLMKGQERDAWELLRTKGGEVPEFDIAGIQKDLDGVLGNLTFKESQDAVPGVLKELAGKVDDSLMWLEDADGGPQVLRTSLTLPEFQEARSILLGVVRDSKSPMATKEMKRAASFAIPVLEEMQSKMDDWASLDTTGKSLEWLEARRLTLELKDLYDLDSPIIRVAERGGTQKNLFTALRSGTGKPGSRTTPLNEAKRLVRIAQQTERGPENLRRMALQDILSEGLNGRGLTTAKRRLRDPNTEEMYRLVLGERQLPDGSTVNVYDKALELMEETTIASRGKAGTPAQAVSTGSGVGAAEQVFSLAKAANEPIPGLELTKKLLASPEFDKLDIEQSWVLMTLLDDPQFALLLSEMPVEATSPAWRLQWHQLLKKAGSKGTAARSAARTAAQERSN